MAYLDEFHKMVGDTIMECQRIEHDIKLMYAGMLKGDFYKNLEKIKDKSLGPVLEKLEDLDNSDNKPYLSKNDYDLLQEIKDVRNWLVHKSYMDFMYDKYAQWDRNLNESYKKLKNFYNRMKSLSNQVENVRCEMMKHFGRA